MNDKMELEEAVEILLKFKQNINSGKRVLDMPSFHKKIALAIETVLKELKNSIPKKRVEDKIRELEENGYWEFLEERDLDETINILQELLEGN